MTNYDVKPVTASKTVWINAVTFAIAVLGLLAGQDWIQANPKWVAVITMATSACNIALRFLTDKAVSLFQSSRRFR